jgi:drug/metabolite transporter (DMT)-like permease
VRLTKRTIIDVALLVLVNSMMAAQYAAYKTASENMGPITLSAWTFLIAGFALLPFLMREKRESRNKEGPKDSLESASARSEHGHLAGEVVFRFIILGLVGLIPASAFLAWGTKHSTASNAALIYLTIPIITALLASVIVHEKMTLVKWGSLAIAFVGVLILSGFDWRHMDLASSKYAIANFAVLLACTSSSFYNVYSKKLLRRFTPLEVLVYGYWVAVVASVPLLIWVEHFTFGSVLTYSVTVWIALLILSVVSWGLAMVLWMYLLKRLDVSQASVSFYLLPFLGVVISAITLHEKITHTMIFGGLVTLVGTILITSTETTAQ